MLERIARCGTETDSMSLEKRKQSTFFTITSTHFTCVHCGMFSGTLMDTRFSDGMIFSKSIDFSVNKLS